MNAWRRPGRTTLLLKTLLWVWLFGLAAGWANACVVQARAAAHGHEPAHESTGVWPGQAALSFPATPHHPTDAALEACLSFCDSGQDAIAKPKLPGPVDVEASVAAAVGAWVSRSLAPSDAHTRALAPPAPPGPPLAIRFLRLTL